ncbi:MAG: hypothetical protein AB7F79_12370 [Steroidobacteraceae bacterium]
MTIAYRYDLSISSQQFIDVLTRSTLGVRRPLDEVSNYPQIGLVGVRSVLGLV